MGPIPARWLVRRCRSGQLVTTPIHWQRQSARPPAAARQARSTCLESLSVEPRQGSAAQRSPPAPRGFQEHPGSSGRQTVIRAVRRVATGRDRRTRPVVEEVRDHPEPPRESFASSCESAAARPAPLPQRMGRAAQTARRTFAARKCQAQPPGVKRPTNTGAPGASTPHKIGVEGSNPLPSRGCRKAKSLGHRPRLPDRMDGKGFEPSTPTLRT